jgi:hypothetical protein
MRNRWYVLAIAAPALLLAYWAISLALADNGIMALVPGALAGALFFGAYRVARSSAFAPAPPPGWSDARPPTVTRWLKERDAQQSESARTPTPKA